MDSYDVIKTVSVTEKSTDLTEHLKYTFIVDPRADKRQIKSAVESIFERKVASVNVLNRKGKVKRTRYGIGKTASTKRAIVTLQDGEEPIELF